MSSCLHLLLTDSIRAWTDCSTCVAEGDQVLLLGEGVEARRHPGFDATVAGWPAGTVLLRRADAVALAPETSDQWRLISDQQWVDAVAEHPHCLSWT